MNSSPSRCAVTLGRFAARHSARRGSNLNRKQFIEFEFAATSRIPAMYESSVIVPEGGLMSDGSSLEDEFREAARTSIRFSRARRGTAFLGRQHG
jgi:hypothetical protein